MREKPRGHYIDEAERLALLVRKHREKFSAQHLTMAGSILFWVDFDPALIRNSPDMSAAIEAIRDAAESMELLHDA